MISFVKIFCNLSEFLILLNCELLKHRIKVILLIKDKCIFQTKNPNQPCSGWEEKNNARMSH